MASVCIPAVYFGAHEANILNGGFCSRSLEEKIVERLESVHDVGYLSKVKTNCHEEIWLEVTKHGLRISSKLTKLVRLRVPLLDLVLLTAFRDGFGKLNAVLVERNRSKQCLLHLFLLADEPSTVEFRKLIKATFSEAEEASALIEAIEPPSPSLK
ncbi:unnamed protein product [Caenorhabditis sp. 36 PRJEB53466]|nr:unnamed protein product [Caenorhabditis sp. 36 PRJEB53466]